MGPSSFLTQRLQNCTFPDGAPRVDDDNCTDLIKSSLEANSTANVSNGGPPEVGVDGDTDVEGFRDALEKLGDRHGKMAPHEKQHFWSSLAEKPRS